MEVKIRDAEELTDATFKQKVVDLLTAQQDANKKNLQLWVGVFIMTVLLWLFQLIQLIFK